MRICIYNPLPVALAHYEREMLAVLDGSGLQAEMTVVRTTNEDLGRLSQLRSLVRHVRTLRRLAKSNDLVIVLWPLLGWYELPLLRSRTAETYVVVHDPKPLRPQIGLGRIAAGLAGTFARRHPAVVSHSETATVDIRGVLPRAEILTLPHPVLPLDAEAGGRGPQQSRPRTVGVFGQYKEARDLEFLVALAEQLGDIQCSGTIKGRAWPDVAGWSVDSRFLSEGELDDCLRGAGAVLIPYKRYYQSGIAIRAIEVGTPIVGRRTPFLEQLLGHEYPGLVDGEGIDAWLPVIAETLERPPSPADQFTTIGSAWRAALERGSPEPMDA